MILAMLRHWTCQVHFFENAKSTNSGLVFLEVDLKLRTWKHVEWMFQVQSASMRMIASTELRWFSPTKSHESTTIIHTIPLSNIFSIWLAQRQQSRLANIGPSNKGHLWRFPVQQQHWKWANCCVHVWGANLHWARGNQFFQAQEVWLLGCSIVHIINISWQQT